MNPTDNPALQFIEQQLNTLQTQKAKAEALLADPEMMPLAEAEIAEINQQIKALEESKSSILGSDEAEGELPKTAIIEIRGGAGGDEAKIWGSDLLRMYLSFCEKIGFKVEMQDELVFKVRGRKMIGDNQVYAYEYLRSESGVHRVQRVPSTESQGRIHTSTASVAVLPEVSERAIEIKPQDLEWKFTRAGGHGGQNVNKVSSAVELTHLPSGLKVESRRERNQEANRKIALEYLRAQLWELEEEKRLQTIGDARASIGRNMRTEKIKTYNFPQNRLTDHRINKSWYNLSEVLEGDLEKILNETYQELNKD